MVCLLVGNKSDVGRGMREVTREEGEKKAEEEGIDFLEVSALDGENVKEAFER